MGKINKKRRIKKELTSKVFFPSDMAENPCQVSWTNCKEYIVSIT